MTEAARPASHAGRRSISGGLRHWVLLFAHALEVVLIGSVVSSSVLCVGSNWHHPNSPAPLLLSFYDPASCLFAPYTT